MYRHIDDIGIFGGEPLFATPRPIGQLAKPPFEAFLELARPGLEHRPIGGAGLVETLEGRLAEFHGVAHCVAVANAGLALIFLMHFFADGRRGEVIMPAFSYRGLPHFAQWAGQAPRFCDVQAGTHGLDPVRVSQLVSDRTTSILAVCNFNSPGAIDELCEVAAACQLPIFFDSVYAFSATYKGRMLGSAGAAEVYSLHATKVLNGFEGGYVTTADGRLAQAIRTLRDANGLGGINARLHDLHAAMALASLDEVDSVIHDNHARFQAYAEMCRGLPGLEMLPCGEAGERSAFALAILEVGDAWPYTRDETIALLVAEGAAIGAYYSPPLHRSPHAPSGPVPALPVSEALSRKYLQLPGGALVSLEDIERIAERLAFFYANADAIGARMRAGAVT